MMSFKKIYFYTSSILLSILVACSSKPSHETNGEEGRVSLNSDSTIVWQVTPQDSIGRDSLNIFQANYNTGKWVKAVVPGTVFTSYVEAGIEKDPNFGDNIYKIDKKKYDRNFWYRTSIAIPKKYTSGKIWLNFEGINRKADIFLNGKKLGHLDGFMNRGKFDITKIASKDEPNVLAILVYCPKLPIPNYASPTYISSASWDWMPYVPGLLTGITDDVYLSNSGNVTIQDPWIRTVALKENEADLSIQTELINHSDTLQSGILKAVINPGNISIEKTIQLAANETKTLKFNPEEYQQLTVQNPKLWWPNGYGDPNLYEAKFTFVAHNKVSDEQKEKFGIRQFSYDSIGGVLHFSINGQKVFLKGGNWGMSEYTLRCRGEEYYTKIRLHKEMNFNIIRNWIGSTTDDEFYEACDEYGIMVWDDFWLNSHPNLPRDTKVFNENAIEKIKRLRNHPSIALWCGDNESSPQPPLNDWLREDVATYDANDRMYQPNSHKINGLSGSGPWTDASPQTYFSGYGGFGGDKGAVKGLRSEVGTAVFTTLESFKKFMPKEDWWPRNEMWDKHFFGKSAANAGPDHYEKSINDRYGKAKNLKDFTQKAQLLNLETNKAMFEGWRHSKWDGSSGILIWMSQSAYPSFVWQTYDYYYDLNGAFWGAKRGSEPVHIQWSAADNSVKVINGTLEDFRGLTAEVKVYNMQGEAYKKLTKSVEINAPKNAATSAFTINFTTNNLATNKTVKASSHADDFVAENLTDANSGTRWSSGYSDDQWIYVDLGKKQQISKVRLSWESAYAKAYKIQLSDDAKQWKDVFETDKGAGGIEQINFDPQEARYVRMLGVKRASQWGYSLYEMEVYDKEPNAKDKLSPVHFIKLKLTDKHGKLVSENFYWRGAIPLDYTDLENLKKVNLQVEKSTKEKEGNYYVNATITNPKNSETVALAIRVKLVNSKTGAQYLPTFKTDSYFSLLPGESKQVQLEVAKTIIGDDIPTLVVAPYNNTKE
ncbi:discoidin domain-containing protein [Zhouia sp. PK063]|uniref:discoidin domain-containing protein n=1 Tax=Zhouia sp. PK063 TaxID=3373602 RepID=UPI0037B57360